MGRLWGVMGDHTFGVQVAWIGGSSEIFPHEIPAKTQWNPMRFHYGYYGYYGYYSIIGSYYSKMMVTIPLCQTPRRVWRCQATTSFGSLKRRSTCIRTQMGAADVIRRSPQSFGDPMGPISWLLGRSWRYSGCSTILALELWCDFNLHLEVD